MSIIQDVFKPIYGRPCWQVEQGYGSFLTFEFGEPRLRIREPRQATAQASESVRKRAARRHVYVRGDWHLWIYLCNWKIFLHGQEETNHRSSQRAIKKALAELNGEALVQVKVDESLITTFEFDFGGKLECIPNRKAYRKDADLWLLYEPSEYVFTLRADGQYRHMPGNTEPDKHIWQPLDNLEVVD